MSACSRRAFFFLFRQRPQIFTPARLFEHVEAPTGYERIVHGAAAPWGEKFRHGGRGQFVLPLSVKPAPVQSAAQIRRRDLRKLVQIGDAFAGQVQRRLRRRRRGRQDQKQRGKA